MNKQTRTYEEIITLQDKAIEALTQANAALVMALEALKKARAEHGFPVQLPGLGLGQGSNGISAGGFVNPAITTPYVPNTTPGIQWGNGQTSGYTVTNTAGLTAKTVTAQSLIQQANSQKELASAYIKAFQAEKEHDGISQVGGCVSFSQSSNE